MILGGYLKVKPIVELENVMAGLKKSLPERAWKLLPQNEEAIKFGAEIIKRRQLTTTVFPPPMWLGLVE
jgi:2-oxoglutarate ferredoxin oxidoreductase subunit gamma